jgi:nitroreductase
MDVEEAIYKRRTIRRFKQTPISVEILKKLIDYARVAPMGNNVQSLDYIIVFNSDTRKKLFPLLSWAASLPEEERVPETNRHPMAYIIVILNNLIKKDNDSEVGGAIENILLGATKYDLGSCWMGAIDRKKIRELFKIPDNYDIRYVISLGYPDEQSEVESYKDSFKYWKDNENLMHVPKKSLDDIILKIY